MAYTFPSRPGAGRPPLFRLAVGLAAGYLLAAAWADVRLPAVFTDHMVLQQGIAVPVWGWADDGEKVTVQFRDRTASTVAQGGRWQVRLGKLKAGGPDPLVVTGNNRIEIQDVLVGEVWICSGQSNMEWPLRAAYEPGLDITNSANSKLRLFTVPKLKAKEPVREIQAAWKLCGPDTTRDFSAVAYYFGRALQQARRVPVGLIHTSWGGSPAEAWTSEATLKADPDYQRDILAAYETAHAKWQEAVAQWEKEKAEAEKSGQKFERGRPWEPWRPAELYNGMIAPLIPYAIAGAIWYQGESNAGRAEQYRRLFPDMIRNWRQDWDQGNFTFLAVQLAPWDKGRRRSLAQIGERPTDSDWPRLREAQVHATRVLPRVGLAVITDVGDKDDIHPAKKAPVGERLALAARVIAYREPIHGLSPTFRSAHFGGGKALVSFDHVGAGLISRGDDPIGFAIAGDDGQFVWARARIVAKDKVEVRHPRVPQPKAVRFGWADYPLVNLFSRDGLPASPFRTDHYPLEAK